MAATDTAATMPSTTDMDAQVHQRARALYRILVQCCRGRARKMAMGTTEKNGYALWYILKREYEPVVQGRYQTMLMALLKPEGWKDIPLHSFENILTDWETDITRYESQSSKTFDSDNRCATVLAHAPDALVESLLAGSSDNRATWVAMRQSIQAMITGRRRYTTIGVVSDENAM